MNFPLVSQALSSRTSLAGWFAVLAGLAAISIAKRYFDRTNSLNGDPSLVHRVIHYIPSMAIGVGLGVLITQVVKHLSAPQEEQHLIHEELSYMPVSKLDESLRSPKKIEANAKAVLDRAEKKKIRQILEKAAPKIRGILKEVTETMDEKVWETLNPQESEAVEKMACKIQGAFRAYREGKKVRKEQAPLMNQHFLPKEVRAQVKTFLADPKAAAPKASDGKTRVFFPKNLPDIVLKLSKDRSYKRLCQMGFVRQICKKDNLPDLVIPGVRLYRDQKRDVLLIEQRLPIRVAPLEQLKLYTEHSEQFTPAIRQFVYLALTQGISDLIGITVLKKRHGEPRYDNFTLFIDKDGLFKIALVDLESIKKEKKIYINLLAALIYIFPLHFDEILDEAKKIGVTEAQLAELDLEEARTRGNYYIKIRYTDFLSYLQKKKNNNTIKMSARDKKEILDVVILKMNKPDIQREELEKCLDGLCQHINDLEVKKSVFGEKVITIRPDEQSCRKWIHPALKSKPITPIAKSILEEMAERKIIYSSYEWETSFTIIC